MKERHALSRLRAFLHLLALALFAGTIAELIAAGHDAGAIQLIPFVLCGIGIIATLWVWRRPDRETVRTVRVLLVGIALGSLFGVYEHLKGNYGFVTEVRPNAGWRTLIEETLTGRAPFMAPGILAIAASIAIAATYASRALDQRRLITPIHRQPLPQRRFSAN
jgi:Na+/melibiose symporter-like transporter